MNKANINKILVVSKNADEVEIIQKALNDERVEPISAENAASAFKIMEDYYPLMVIVTRSSGIPADIFGKKILNAYPSTELIGFDINGAVPPYSFNISAEDNPEMLSLYLNKVLKDYRALQKCGMSGRSASVKEIAHSILSAAPTDLTILITGPSGVGKEVAAKAIHNNSSRAKHRFFSVNCGALSEGILSSELFGHERGAFTGAVSLKKGVFESAGEGTIFLDEIGEISPEMQVKLLRVLEDGTFYRVGGTQMLKSKARVVAATNRELYSEVSAGGFRRDLYYRLRVVEITIPPLADRLEDIPVLVERFITEKGFQFKHTIPPDTLDILLKYRWHGNIRELKNFIESRIALSPSKVITRDNAEIYIRDSGYQHRQLPVSTGLSPDAAERQLILQAIMSLKNEITALRKLIVDNLPKAQEMAVHPMPMEAKGWVEGAAFGIDKGDKVKSMEEAEREAIVSALEKFRGNRKKAAEALGIGERTLYRKIAKYGLR